MTDAELCKALRWKAGIYAKQAANRIEQLVATIEALIAENKRLGQQCEGLMQAGMNNGQALIIAEAKLAKAVEALEFYAAWDNWTLDERGVSLVDQDEGKKARAERAEAALAAPKVMHEDAPAAIVGEIGNQIHNLGCELQNDEDVSLRLSDLACRCWDAAKLFPTDRTALDMLTK